MLQIVLQQQLLIYCYCYFTWISCGSLFLCSVGANPFDDEEEDEEDFSNVVGVPVEALYDYVGQEDDELSFKQGIAVQSLKWSSWPVVCRVGS